MTLLRRCLAVKLKDSWNTGLLMAQAPVIAVLIAIVFGDQSGDEITQQSWPDVAQANATTVFLLSLCENSA